MPQIVEHPSAANFCASGRRASGRVHLPVAPRPQARVRFTPEKALPRALTPEQAVGWLDYLAGQGEVLKAVNLLGPGDPLATPELTSATLELLTERHPGLSRCLTTLGLGAVGLAPELAKLGLAHVSLLMDAVDPVVMTKLYAWIRPGTRNLPLGQAAALLSQEQPAAIAALVAAGIPVKVKTTVYPGVNDAQVVEIAQVAAQAGASELKLFAFQDPDPECPRPQEELSPEALTALAQEASQYLPAQFVDLEVCRQAETPELDQATAPTGPPKPSAQRPYLAVCSSDGLNVDLHLGQTDQYLIYGAKDGPVVLLESRPAPEPGGGDLRWQQADLTLKDCFAVLAAAAGETPRRLLTAQGLAVITQEGDLRGLVEKLFGLEKKKGCRR